jgi:misacylated tRNA(Ala) deacylase
MEKDVDACDSTSNDPFADLPATELLYLSDAYVQSFSASIVAVDENRIALDTTIFYPTGGGQPHDTGTFTFNDGSTARVVDVTKKGTVAWHVIDNVSADIAPGSSVHGKIDWDRRHQLMRTHTALHVLCGVIWNTWGAAVTGGNMEPLKARMDFEFDPLPEGFTAQVEELVNAALVTDYKIEVGFLPHAAAQTDPELIRTKVNMIPSSVTEIRVVDIVGLDKQADGGTHVRSTAEVGRIVVGKTESKGKGNKRMRIEIVDR